VEIRSLQEAKPFTTKDGSTIRELLGLPTSSANNQSLAEATLRPGGATQRHYHRETEEIYYVIEGSGEMEVDGERAQVSPGDAVLIPPGAWHEIRAAAAGPLRFLCCCAPPYRHEDTFFDGD
jgi:mannose-6-phosphate isomerase-like protein (cupin superfamily)